ncbi:MAG: T9SS type A sorting domain-containing protein [Sphingobacteriales bacterium]|nr:T9SS type A sorting domain-containing protein [Sphingobacteriales bacterium]MBI3718990.1 T9SS type A sorting domain-containing protein [Sphingobacteriales bacterium]
MKNILFLLVLFSVNKTFAQKKQAANRCANEALLKAYLKRGAEAVKNFHLSEKRIAAKMLEIQQRKLAGREQAVVTVPVVFHIVLPNTSVVTDAAINAQLNVLNTDYSGSNADSTKIPAAFKPLFAKTNIRFTLAQRTPDDEPTTGIDRTESAVSSTFNVGDPVKHRNKGGADIWDPSRYLNIWVTNIPGGILGYAKLPDVNDIPTDEDGVVILYQTLPGTSFTPYNLGRTGVHEVGHYFRLLHIWGDDNGTCAGSDFPDAPAMDDTPNQANSTSGCPSGVVTDACSPVAPGIMYENYMDFTDDACMVMFSKGQQTRMEAALSLYRPGLLTSNGGTPVTLLTRNVKAQQIISPTAVICASSFQPVIKIRNLASTVLTSLQISASVDGGTVVTTNWTGSVASLSETSVTLSSITGITSGTHNLIIYTSQPNGASDEFVKNDTIKSSFVYPSTTGNTLKEGFESTVFPPNGWAIDNPDNSLTWERTTLAAKTGNASVRVHNFDYPAIDEKDYLITPIFPVNNADSTFLTFQLAAVTFSSPSSPGVSFDTLEVLVTSDCGVTYQSVYKKGGAALITSPSKADGYQAEFIPLSDEWRKDSIYLTPYLNNVSNLQVVFKNICNYENNVYLDDINLYNYFINPILKEKGLLITPNPFSSSFYVQHYPNPTTLKGIAVYNSLGQLIMQRTFAVGQASTNIEFNLGGLQTGMYYVKVFYTDKTVTQKILKTN